MQPHWDDRQWRESVPCSFWFPTSRQKPDFCQRTVSTGSAPGSFWAPGFGWSRRWCAVACSRSPESRLPGQISGGGRTPALWPGQTQSNTKDWSHTQNTIHGILAPRTERDLGKIWVSPILVAIIKGFRKLTTVVREFIRSLSNDTYNNKGHIAINHCYMRYPISDKKEKKGHFSKLLAPNSTQWKSTSETYKICIKGFKNVN